MLLRQQRADQRALFNQRDCAVLQFPRRIRFGHDVADFLQFQGRFHCQRVVQPAPDVEYMLPVVVQAGEALHGGFERHHLLRQRGNVRHLPQKLRCYALR